MESELHEAIHRATNPLVLVQRVADAALELVEGCEGVLVGLLGSGTAITYVTGAGYHAGHVGETSELHGSLSGVAIGSGETMRCDDTETDPRVNKEQSRHYGVRSAVMVPLHWRDEQVGVLNVSSRTPHAFDDSDVATLDRLARFVSVVVGAAADLAAITDALLAGSPDGAARAAAEGRDVEAEERFVASVLTPGSVISLQAKSSIEGFLEGRGFVHQFQPIFDIVTGQLFGAEALARFATEPMRTPDDWFADAHSLGRGIDLEVTSVTHALEALSRLPPGCVLCINAGPEAVCSAELLDAVAAADSDRVVIELTEQVRVDDYPRLADALERIRATGARLAIDDTGAGFASLAHILKLGPDIIKLDRALTTGIDRDPVRRALAAALVDFAVRTGSQIVAEGIETAEELRALRELGIRYGQGYYLGRPMRSDSVPDRLPPEQLVGP